ncbi:protein kinase family protein [Thermosporothrix hazakensis]|uniref:protein kinase family protein n=1 Tax=Thermosporothrix hazakensis TaxID=644383 RepID=UPI0014731750|nr:protein kinase family protein [Thermosporothrix hazakensis]
MTPTINAQKQPSGTHCPHCETALPQNAVFCSSCGARIEQNSNMLSSDTKAIDERYHITALVRRQPAVQIFLATDNRLQRPVAIRDIDTSSLDQSTQARALKAIQQEYDLLRQEHPAGVLPVIDLRSLRGHVFVIAGQQVQTQEKSSLHVLQHQLQSGNGLPDTKTAIRWTLSLCRTLSALHRHQIFLGDLDPYTIVIRENDSTPELIVSWLTPAVRQLLPAKKAKIPASKFTAPEIQQNPPDARADLYSLGALLYLFLTGAAPERDIVKKQEFPARFAPILQRTLTIESAQRFQHADELAAALETLASNDSSTSKHTDKQQGKHDPEATIIASGPLPYQMPEEKGSPTSDDVVKQPTRKLSEPVPIDQQETMRMQPFASRQHEPPPSGAPSPQQSFLPVPAQPQKPALSRELSQTMHRVKQRLTTALPAIMRVINQLPIPASKPGLPAPHKGTVVKSVWLKHLQSFVLGTQRRDIQAAALVETPLRIRPEQPYQVRITIMGRNHPTRPIAAPPGSPIAGLSALTEGDIVHLEVRSVLAQGKAYVIQRAEVQVPGYGYAAEVLLPMPPFEKEPGGRRERLYISIKDGKDRLLYEQPFVVELFISHLVQSGREGHNVLPIPI